VIIAAVVAAAAFAGVVGYKLGSISSLPIVIQQLPSTPVR
jgi:hypothetical protein